MPEPFLDFGDVRLVGEGVCCGSRAHRMHAQAVDLNIDSRLATVLRDDVLQDGAGIKMPVQHSDRVV